MRSQSTWKVRLTWQVLPESLLTCPCLRGFFLAPVKLCGNSSHTCKKVRSGCTLSAIHSTSFGHITEWENYNVKILGWFPSLKFDLINKMACAPSKDSDQPGHPPSLIRVFAARMKKAWVLSNPLSAQQRLWSDWADAQADPSLRWAHSHFVGFVMRRLIC